MSILRNALLAGLVSLGLLWGPGPSEVAAQGAEADAYVRTVAAHFQVPESEAHILLEERMSTEELPVLLLLARETGIAPTALLASRRSGQNWIGVSRRFDMPASRFHVEIPMDVAGPELQRAMRAFAETPSAQWGSIDFSDEEIMALVHVKVLSRYFELSPERIMEARSEAGNWIGVPARLARP